MEIWPVELAFTNFAKGADSRRQTLAVGPLRVEVGSLVSAESPKLSEVRPDIGPVELPFSYVVWFAVGAAGVVVAIVAFGFWKSYQARQKIKAAPAFDSSRIGGDRTERIGRFASGRAGMSSFFMSGSPGLCDVSLNGRPASVPPSKLPKNFYVKSVNDRRLSQTKIDGLKNFLEAADMVKFAAYRPLEGDVESSIDRAKDFVGLGDQPAAT